MGGAARFGELRPLGFVSPAGSVRLVGYLQPGAAAGPASWAAMLKIFRRCLRPRDPVARWARDTAYSDRWARWCVMPSICPAASLSSW